MSYLDQEIKNEIAELNIGKFCKIIEVKDDLEKNTNQLEDLFFFKNNQIDWEKTSQHEHYEITHFLDNLKNLNMYAMMISSKEIIYINDDSLVINITFCGEIFNEFLFYALDNIPQHHYFFMPNEKACLVIRSLGYVDFGYSTKPE